MSRKIFTILLLFTALFSGCINKENIEHTIAGNNKLVVDFSVQGNVGVKSGAEDPLAFESKVTHLDMFFFDNSNSNLYHYERIYVAEGESGNKVIHGMSLKTLVEGNKILKAYVVANSSKTEEHFGNVTTISTLKDEIETTTYVNITGFEGLDVDAPDTFLMTGLAVKFGDANTVPDEVPDEASYEGINFSKWDFNNDFRIKVTLVRSAAKVEVTFKKEDNSEHIYSFGRPSGIDEEKLKNEFSIGEFTYSYSDMSYYMRNLRYKTHFWGNNIQDKRKTNPITNSGYMVATAEEIKVSVYTYSCSWGGQTSSVFETAPFLIVNLPAVIYTDKENNKAKYVAQNFYEIPLRQIIPDNNDQTPDIAQIERNHYYKITATVDAAGSQSSMVPYKLNPVLYDVYEWNNKYVSVGTSEKAKFLSLSTSSIEMRNTSSNSDIKFSSSSPIQRVYKTEAYYIDKFGTKKTVDFPTASAPYDVLSGNITVKSIIPQDTEGLDNVVVYMTFTVTNNDGLTQQFTVRQYPTVYIQGILSHFSYRTDFGANYADGKGSKGYVSADEKPSYSNNTWWTLSSSVGSEYTKFQSKVVASNVRNDGTALLQFYYWDNKNSLKQKNVKNNSPLYLNPRMYQVTITSSSSEYKVGRPKLDDNGYTASDVANNQLVSPSFIIASGLGSTLSISSAEAAKDHCSKYAEAYKDENGKYVKLEGWRLPTEAEIKVIVKFQQGSQAMDEVLTGSHYHCANGKVATNIPGAQSTTALRCIRDVYKSPSN